ncbi:hypothetical protein Fcan01_21832 [Folsomia candida]|uniref:Uncharacterized protein n=1 Tax=Folsomia candida TaxID=158441 RepID=A0A226DF98_FOLCA|nr:hypothetical protein Fcan01_21832 [Folsomia candida]
MVFDFSTLTLLVLILSLSHLATNVKATAPILDGPCKDVILGPGIIRLHPRSKYVFRYGQDIDPMNTSPTTTPLPASTPLPPTMTPPFPASTPLPPTTTPLPAVILFLTTTLPPNTTPVPSMPIIMSSSAFTLPTTFAPPTTLMLSTSPTTTPTTTLTTMTLPPYPLTDPITFSSITKLSAYCHKELNSNSDTPELEMIGIRHLADWKSLQKILMEDLVRFFPNHPPKKDDIIFGTSIRYRSHYKPRPTFTNEGIATKPAFLVWDGVNFPVEPKTKDTSEMSVHLVAREGGNHLVLTAHGVNANESNTTQVYRAICQFPSDSECFRNSEEEVNAAKDAETKTVRLMWTSRAIFEITDRPVLHHVAPHVCSGKRPDGLNFHMWDGEKIVHGDDPPSYVYWGSHVELNVLGETIHKFFTDHGYHEKSHIFMSPNSKDKMKRRQLDGQHFSERDDIRVEKNSGAFVLCVYRFKSHCQD